MSADNEIALLEYNTLEGLRYRVANTSTSAIWIVPDRVAGPLTDEQLVSVYYAWHDSQVFDNRDEAKTYQDAMAEEIEKNGGIVEYGCTWYEMECDFPTQEQADAATQRLKDTNSQVSAEAVGEKGISQVGETPNFENGGIVRI